MVVEIPDLLYIFFPEKRKKREYQIRGVLKDILKFYSSGESHQIPSFSRKRFLLDLLV